MLKSDNIVSSRQFLIARVVAWAMIVVLGIRYFQIQIIEHELYRLKSNTNRIRKVTKNAPRGLILDRKGEILVDNYPVYVLTAIPGEMSNKNQDELTGFEYELTSFQDYANQFSEDTAVSNLAFKQGMPKDGSFSGRLLCGFAKKPNELKKDGSPKWYCTYKFPFDYYSLINNKGELKRCYFTKEEALKRKEKGDKIKKNHYEGCPCHIPKKQPDFDFDFGFNSSNEKDDFDLDKF